MKEKDEMPKMDEHSIRDIWTAHLLKYRPKKQQQSSPNMQYVRT